MKINVEKQVSESDAVDRRFTLFFNRLNLVLKRLREHANLGVAEYARLCGLHRNTLLRGESEGSFQFQTTLLNQYLRSTAFGLRLWEVFEVCESDEFEDACAAFVARDFKVLPLLSDLKSSPWVTQGYASLLSRLVRVLRLSLLRVSDQRKKILKAGFSDVQIEKHGLGTKAISMDDFNFFFLFHLAKMCDAKMSEIFFAVESSDSFWPATVSSMIRREVLLSLPLEVQHDLNLRFLKQVSVEHPSEAVQDNARVLCRSLEKRKVTPSLEQSKTK